MPKKIIFLTLLLLFAFVDGFSQTKATVSSDGGAAIRAKPSSKGKIISMLKRGAKLKLDPDKAKKGWYFVSGKNKQGWIRSKKVLVEIDDPGKGSVWLYIGRSKSRKDFSVRFYLNAAQVVRNGNAIKFWTKIVPSNKSAYMSSYFSAAPKENPGNFKYNADLWEGNCSTKKLRPVRSLVYWKNRVSQKQVNKGLRIKRGENSVARVILDEACKASRRF